VERDNEFVVKAEMPGMKKDDIEVSLENGVLTITAETKSETEERKVTASSARSAVTANTCAACASARKSDERRSRPATRTVFLNSSYPRPKK